MPVPTTIRRAVGRLLGLAGLLAVILSGCGPQRAVRSALTEDLASLEASIEAARRRGQLDPELTREIAEAVAERVVVSAEDPNGATMLLGATACRHALVDAYETRASRRDATGAAALTVLVADGQVKASAILNAYQHAREPEWLAVAARAAITPEYSAWRREQMRHPDARVRRAVLRAALRARAEADVPELLVASRVDPDTLSRRLAIGALGAIATPRAMVALQDRWRSGDFSARHAVVDAWARPAAFARGGEDALRKIALAPDPAAVAALRALLRWHAGPPWAQDRVARLIDTRPERERLQAIELASVNHPRALAALLRATKDDTAAVRVAAWAQLLGSLRHATRARRELRTLAGEDGPSAYLARSALARAGERTVVPLLERQLRSQSTDARLRAALALIDLGMPEKAASMLAEANRDARFQVACAMMETGG